MSRDERQNNDFKRREFLRLAGFALGGTTLVGCSRGVEHGVMPFLVRPEEVTPGKAYWYASVCGACPAGCGVLTKNRDGRPIKLEGNPDHPVSAGGLCAIGQASVVGLYDSKRLRNPLRQGQPATWREVDREIADRLAAVLTSGGGVRFLTDSTSGPTERRRIADFLAPFGGRHVTYDAFSVSAIADAHRETHGLRVVPRYRFERAEVIVGLGADFLGQWLSPVEHAAGYRAGRAIDHGAEKFSHHIQLESRMTLTGSNADRRVVVPSGAMASIAAQLAGELAKLSGTRPPFGSTPASPVDVATIAEIARALWDAPRGRTLVVCGENDLTAQRLTNYVNHLLGNYAPDAGKSTIDLDGHAAGHHGDEQELARLLDEIEAGSVAALFVRGINPLYDLPDGERVARALERVELVVSFAERENETARLAGFVCPEPHYLEAWGDAESVAGVVSLRQPALRSIGSTRPLLESLATWSGRNASAYDLLRESWRSEVFPRRQADAPSSFDAFWNATLHDGSVRLQREDTAHAFDASAVTAPRGWREPETDAWALELHPSAGMFDGRHAHNPWLHELPDPIAKTVWDNFAAISRAAADALDVSDGDVIRLTVDGTSEASIELPALVQSGQHTQTVAVGLGYGREGTDRFARVGPQWLEGRLTLEPGETIGTNAAPLLAWSDGRLAYGGRRVRVEKAGRRHTLVTTQLHHSLDVPKRLAMGGKTHRAIAQETTLAEWRRDPGAGGHGHHDTATLWHDHPKEPHHWGMAIDLTACTGCSACVIACQAENNVPVVGKDEVRRAREMHWMRIDRYYGGEEPEVDVVHMPMMCQHCDNAPCETVCPVQATVQSAEGLNQQIYNRCVGTRYCANNCPYKVRRFNWFDYPHDDRLQNLVLNPDVTVRSRGVMEKCSLCVQRIQDAKAEAKRVGRPLADGDIQPACAQSCPANAIAFGDTNDPESQVAQRKHDPRHFTVLEELGVKPVVGYLTLVRNREEE
ncbi:MAG: 4Fe-4S dicluster domain-containing protein [bacterium]|nr:4Fe-4S dicluster domain-containing protein [bacterium]